MLDPHRSRSALAMGAALATLSLPDLAVRCAGVGDVLTTEHLARLLWSTAPRSAYEHDVVAATLNDRLVEDGLNRPVSISRDLASGSP